MQPPNEYTRFRNMLLDSTRGSSSSDRIEPAHAEALRSERLAMLTSIAHRISTRLSDAIRGKIQHEHDVLLHVAKVDARDREIEKERNRVLDGRYFTQVPLASDVC
jgi:hypothetical protein